MDVMAHIRQNLAYNTSLAKFLRRWRHFNPLLQVSLVQTQTNNISMENTGNTWQILSMVIWNHVLL